MKEENKYTIELRRYFLLDALRDKGFRGIKARFAYRFFIESELNEVLKDCGIAPVSNCLVS